MVTSRSSFAGERPIHKKLEEQLGLQSRLMNEMGRNAGQVQAAKFGVVPSPPVPTDTTGAGLKAAGEGVREMIGALAKRQPQQPSTGWSLGSSFTGQFSMPSYMSGASIPSGNYSPSASWPSIGASFSSGSFSPSIQGSYTQSFKMPSYMGGG